MMEKTEKKYGHASLFVIGGHGEPTNIQLGEGEKEDAELDITDKDILTRIKFIMISSS